VKRHGAWIVGRSDLDKALERVGELAAAADVDELGGAATDVGLRMSSRISMRWRFRMCPTPIAPRPPIRAMAAIVFAMPGSSARTP